MRGPVIEDPRYPLPFYMNDCDWCAAAGHRLDSTTNRIDTCVRCKGYGRRIEVIIDGPSYIVHFTLDEFPATYIGPEFLNDRPVFRLPFIWS
jgi:hypothetical protein